jgi:hypothetical protein
LIGDGLHHFQVQRHGVILLYYALSS